MWETWVQSLSREDLLEREITTNPSILAWKSPWTEEPGRLQSKGSQRVFTFTFHFIVTKTCVWSVFALFCFEILIYYN